MMIYQNYHSHFYEKISFKNTNKIVSKWRKLRKQKPQQIYSISIVLEKSHFVCKLCMHLCVYVLYFDLRPGQKCHSKVMHRKEVTHFNGSYERKSRVNQYCILHEHVYENAIYVCLFFFCFWFFVFFVDFFLGGVNCISTFLFNLMQKQSLQKKRRDTILSTAWS